MTPPTNLASDFSYMSRNMLQMDGSIMYSLADRTQVTGFVQDMCRGSSLSESSSTDSSYERAWFADYAGVTVEGPFKGEHQLH